MAIWSCARTSSKDVQKMIKNFCNTTLTDIFLLKLKKLQSKGYNVFLLDMKKFLKKSVKNINSICSANKKISKLKMLMRYIIFKDQDYDFLLQVNACMPMLKVSTIENFLKDV